MLIAAVNGLQALGRTEAIKSLRQYANRAEDAESIFLIVRLLFEPGNRQSRPDILVGRIYPNILEQDKLDWQYFPIALQDDIPFLVGRVTVSLGVPQDPEEHIDWAENHGIFRRTPLSPKTDPVTAAVRLLATEKMRRLMAANPDSDLSTFLRVQTVQSLNVGNTQIGNSWSKLQAELRRNPVSWAPSTQSFVSRE
jgi:hypothetical protein